MSGLLGDVRDDNFEAEVLNSPVPVLVDFWSPWCGPCKQLTPVIEELAEEYKGRARFLKLNIEDSGLTPEKYTVRSIPTLLVFRDGALKDQIVGNPSKETIAKMMDNCLQ